MRLQVDAKVGTRMLEYFWPARRDRKASSAEVTIREPGALSPGTTRSSLDSSLALQAARYNLDQTGLAPFVSHKLQTSRSYTDLRTPDSLETSSISRTQSSPGRHNSALPGLALDTVVDTDMKTRSSLRTFVLVRISRYLKLKLFALECALFLTSV